MKDGLRKLLVIICSAVLVPALSVAILIPAAIALNSCSGDIQETAKELDAEIQAEMEHESAAEEEPAAEPEGAAEDVPEEETEAEEDSETELETAAEAAEPEAGLETEADAESEKAKLTEAEKIDPVTGDEAETETETAATSLRGKTVSILGDSITTFEGYIPEGYLAYYPGNGMTLDNVNDTWWIQMLQRTGMELMVNGSWSGSLVCGDSTAEDSKAGCSYRRLTELKSGNEDPDVILVYMGANDYFAEKELGVWSGAPTVRQDGYIQNFTESYELMLQKLLGLYPDTQLYCLTLIEADGDHPRVNSVGCTIPDYNTRIRQLADAYGIPLIDLHECGMPFEEIHKYTDDGIHPNAAGAEKIAAYVTDELLRMNR